MRRIIPLALALILTLGATASATGQDSPPTIAQLEEIADRYELEIERLKSHDAIENLLNVYGYYIDKGMWREAAALFAEDGSYEYGQRGVYVGPARIRQALGLFGPEGLEQGQLNNYIMVQPIIDVAPDNRTAKVRLRADVQLSRNGEGRWGGGVYENEYVNVDGQWKIKTLHFYVTFLGDYDRGWGEVAYPMQGPSETLPPDRPQTEVYESLPGIYLPAYHYDHPVTGKPVTGAIRGVKGAEQ